MNRVARIAAATALLCVLGRAPAAAPPDFAAYVPEDAYGFLGIGSMTEWSEAFARLPEGKMLEDPEVQAFIRPGREKLRARLESLGDPWPRDMEGLLKLFPGQVAFWLESLEPYKPDEFGAVLVAERTEAPEVYQALIESALEKQVSHPKERSRIEFGGETIYAVKWDIADGMSPEEQEALGPFADYTRHSCLFAFPEGLLMVAFDGDESIQRALTRSREGGGALAASRGYRPLAEDFAGPQFKLFANITSLIEMSKQTQAFWAAQWADMAAEMEIEVEDDPGTDYEGMGISDMLDFHYVTDLRGERSESRGKLRMSENPRGIAKAVGSLVRLDPSIMRAAPPTPVSVTAVGFDISAAANEIVRLIKGDDPSEAWDGIAHATQEATGLSLDGEIIPAFGSHVCSFSEILDAYPDTPVSTHVIALGNPEVFARLFDSLLAQPAVSSMIEKSEFLGSEIYTLNLPPIFGMTAPGAPAFQPTWALAAGQLVLSLHGGETLRSAIARLAGRDSKNYFDEGTFVLPASSGGVAPSGYMMADYTRQAEAMLMGLRQAQMVLAMAGQPGLAAAMAEWVDFNAVPKAETLRQYLGVSETLIYRETDGISFVGRER